ncbi:SpoIVB peptidase [Lachnospiraceae bacterium WCA-9-b2]|uniref:SpoIVB peptidase n=1 Tax=Sporofaciens musculi TaxID=2681861 RepID=A0A7X3MH53_9FIRM|nr:SpoIVB peptidase [Sporofaciens musculi]MCI9423596.1 SpoIVB peptidase [Dorea sp.]MXP76160.1 SpoIVB peptidase [Sporofaciens musculi]
MRKYWYRRILIMIVTFLIAVGGGYYLIEYQRSRLEAEVNAATSSENMVIPGGMPIGIYLETEGVMVLGTDSITAEDGMDYEPAANLVKAGDYIVALNEQTIHDKNELAETVKKLGNEDIILRVRRDEQYMNIRMKPVRLNARECKLGIWVRDNAQGLGTVTFLNTNSRFGALGHGIHDVDTNALLEIHNGRVYETSIRDIQKGQDGTPGGMEGIIVYNNYNVLGNITNNTDCGIFGTIDRIDALFADQTPMETAVKEEIVEGPATIRCAVEGTVKDYQIRVTKIDKNTSEVNKGIVIEVTDNRLLSVTGGIVQGMSGSPIIQNGKLIGAVTHVFVHDATKGYGIFIEDMMKNVE